MQKEEKKMSIFSIQKFSQNIPNLDTLERVWQTKPLKVYNQTLGRMGDNNFSVEHTGVRVRQMAGTLERVVKYDAVAFQKAWDFLVSSNDEDNYYYYYLFIFVELFSPEREKNMAFLGATVFLQPLAHAG